MYKQNNLYFYEEEKNALQSLKFKLDNLFLISRESIY